MDPELEGDRLTKEAKERSTSDPANKFMGYAALVFGAGLMVWAVARSWADIATLELSTGTAGLLLVGLLLLLLSAVLSRR